MKINTVNTVDTVIQDFRDGQNIFRRPSVELMVREISRLQKRIAELELLQFERQTWIDKVDVLQKRTIEQYQEIERQQARIEELEKEKRDILIVFDDNITRRDERIEELEHYKRLNEEWVHEKVEGLTTFEEIEKMVMIADRLNKSNASIRCGWCDAEFETRDQVKEHAYGCKDNPLAQRIDKYNHLIVNLFSFLERDRLVRAHAKEMSEFIQEYREIKKDLPQPPKDGE